MSKQQLSRSKTAFRGFVGYTAKSVLYFSGQVVQSDEDAQNVLAEARIAFEDTAKEIFDGVLFSSTRNIDLWTDRFRERLEDSLNKIRESLDEQLATSLDEAEAEFKRAAAAFGTDVETYSEFLAWDKPGLVSASADREERKTAYTDLQDVLNVYTKIAFAVIHVRYWKGFYYIAVGDSGGRRKPRRRKSRQKKSKKTVRF